MNRPLKLSALMALLLLFIAACDITSTPDTQAPTINNLDFSGSSTITTAGPYTLTANVTDNVGITKVEFFKNNKKVGEQTSAPFTHPYTITSTDNGNLSLKASASDAAGNKTEDTVDIVVNISDGTPNLILSSSSTNVTTAGDITLSATGEGFSSVEFFKNGQSLSSDNSAPFSATDSLTEANNGTIIYTAKANNGDLASNSVSVTVDISSGTNLDATNDSYTTVINTLLEVGVSASGKAAVRVSDNVLSNDAGDNLSVTNTSNVSNGSLDMNPNGNFTFTPTTGFAGTAGFSYEVTDGSETQTASVSIDVKDANPDLAGTQEVIYVDNTNPDLAGDGSANSPFKSLTDITTGGAPTPQTAVGDIIFIFGKADYTCTEACVTLRNNQQLIGQGSELVVNGVTVATGSTNKTVLKDSQGNAIEVANSNTIKGFSINNSGTAQSNEFNGGAIGNNFYRYQAGKDTRGLLLIENVDIDTTYGLAIFIDDATTEDNEIGSSGTYEAVFDTTIRNVSITNPGTGGIWLDDPKNLIIENTTITGFKTVANVANNISFSGRAIEAQTQYDGDFSFSNITLNATQTSKQGLYVLKNDGINDKVTPNVPYPGTYGLTVSMNNNNVSMIDGTAYYIQINEGDDGTLDVTGTANNKTGAADTFTCINSGTVSYTGTVVVAGVTRSTCN